MSDPRNHLLMNHLIGPRPKEGQHRLFVIISDQNKVVFCIMNKNYMLSSVIYERADCSNWRSTRRSKRDFSKKEYPEGFSVFEEFEKVQSRRKIPDDRCFILKDGQVINEEKFKELVG